LLATGSVFAESLEVEERVARTPMTTTTATAPRTATSFLRLPSMGRA